MDLPSRGAQSLLFAPFQCAVCQLRFCTTADLENHVAVHMPSESDQSYQNVDNPFPIHPIESKNDTRVILLDEDSDSSQEVFFEEITPDATLLSCLKKNDQDKSSMISDRPKSPKRVTFGEPVTDDGPVSDEAIEEEKRNFSENKISEVKDLNAASTSGFNATPSDVLNDGDCQSENTANSKDEDIQVFSEEPVRKRISNGSKSVKAPKTRKRKQAQGQKKKPPVKVASPCGIRLLRNRLVMETKDNDDDQVGLKPVSRRKQKGRARSACTNKGNPSGRADETDSSSVSVGVQDEPPAVVPHLEYAHASSSGSCGVPSECASAPISDFGDAASSDSIHTVARSSGYLGSLAEGSEPPTMSTSLERSSEIDQEHVGRNKKRRRRTNLTTQKTDFWCDICKKYFSRVDSLKTHVKAFHSGISSDQRLLGEPAGTIDGIAFYRTPDGCYICDICNKTFPLQYLWRRHRLFHFGKGGLTFTCKICLLVFNDVISLNRHMNTHDLKISKKEIVVQDNQPYHCKICNVKFAHNTPFANHIKKHTKAQTRLKHCCKVCDKSFSTAARLRFHIMVHTGEKPYVCNICNKSFRHPNNLKVHADVHNDKANRIYRCQECDKTYSQKVQLKKHVLRYHLTMRREATLKVVQTQ